MRPIAAFLASLGILTLALIAGGPDGVSLAQPPALTPIPTPGPDDCLPVPTPAPGAAFLGICSAAVAPGGSVTVALTGHFPSSPVGTWTLDVTYDGSLVVLTDITEFVGLCSPSFAADTARCVGASATGLTGDITFGTLTFEAGHDEGIADLDVQINQLTTQGQSIAVTATDGTITITSATPTPSPAPTPTPTPTAAPSPTATPAQLPKSGGDPDGADAPYAAPAALAAAAALALAAGWTAARRLKA